MRKRNIFVLLLVMALTLALGCGREENSVSTKEPEISGEPLITEETKDEKKEEKPASQKKEYENKYAGLTAEEITATLSNSEKAYQMVIPATYQIRAKDMKDFCYGSILSQREPTQYTAETWGDLVDSYQSNALQANSPIPFIYGQDSVHGVNYCLNTVIFPHNINIGAAGDEELTYQMGLAVADEIKLSKMIWNYSPCVAVAQDPRWGRTYESYSSKPEIVKKLSGAYTKGLLDAGVVACAKHYIGDGSVSFGTGEDSEGEKRLIDRGDAVLSEEEIKEQLSIYENLVAMGVQSIMVSHSALNGVKMHENKYYLTDVLRGELGFEGVIVSDWNSVQNITGAKDYKEQIIISVNAGVDWLMEPDRFSECAQYLVEAVEEGSISQQRMDEAVTRIIQLKMDAGLFEDPYLDGMETVQKETGSKEYRDLAEKLVEKSQVLIKNEQEMLPLKEGMKVFVTGPAANDSGVQCGGWTRARTGLSDEEYGGEFIPGTTTILEGLENVAKEFNLTIITEEEQAASADVTLLCLGEQPYAEWIGDTEDLSITGSHGLTENQKAIETAKALGKPTVALIVAGRNVLINEYVDAWDAVVMCGLPGSEGGGIANVLVGKTPFTGTLSMPWYEDVKDIDSGNAWLEPGYGLTTETSF